MKKQLGNSFLSWMATAGVAIFLVVTVVKLLPAYLEFHSVKGVVEEVAVDQAAIKGGKKAMLRKVEDYLDINGLYEIKKEYFSVEPVEGKKNVFALVADYKVKKHWLANIDFDIHFKHAAEIKRR